MNLRTYVTALLTVLPVTLLAQAVTYTPDQVERVAKLSELYGHIKFFHPYLGYKPINWDSAFAATAPLVANAKTDDETIAAIRQLLAVLGDDATTVKRTEAPKTTSTTPSDSMQLRWLADSTLVFQANNFEGGDYDRVYARLMNLIKQVPKARALLLDLRSSRPLTEYQDYEVSSALDDSKLARYLTKQPILTSGERRRQHSGFAPETGQTSGGYWSGFYTLGGKKILPVAGATDRPVVILLNKESPLPPEFTALHGHPNMRLLSTDPLTDAQLAPTKTFPFSERITVEFRVGELVNPDGSLGMTDIPLVPTTTQPNAVTAHALTQLRTPPAPAVAPNRAMASLPIAPPVSQYAPATYPTLGYRLLAGAKIWSVIHYFFAYKELMPTSWNTALRTAVGQLANAADSTQYALAVARFYRNIQDSHGFIGGTTSLRDYAGSGGVSVGVRFIEDKPVITDVFADSLRTKGLRVGDLITSVNGEPIADRIARLAAIQPASNEWTRRRNLTYRLLRSVAGTPIRIGLLGTDGQPKTVSVICKPDRPLQPPPDTVKPFKRLPGNIGYAHMGRLKTSDVPAMFKAFEDTKAIIFDMRNYPNGTAWAITPYLTDRKNVTGAKFFRYAPNQPAVTSSDEAGTVQKSFFDQHIPGNTGQTVYRGKTVMLIDERTQSQAEHSGLFFEAANGTEFIGSPSAGANGDVTNFQIPGGISLTFSGHDVRHADGRQLQQVGLQPKILVRPTIKALRAGKDEVLERAITYLNKGK